MNADSYTGPASIDSSSIIKKGLETYIKAMQKSGNVDEFQLQKYITQLVNNAK